MVFYAITFSRELNSIGGSGNLYAGALFGAAVRQLRGPNHRP